MVSCATASTSRHFPCPQGIAGGPGNQVFAILEATGQEAMFVSMPAVVLAPSTCSGDGGCAGDIDGADLADFERGDCQ